VLGNPILIVAVASVTAACAAAIAWMAYSVYRMTPELLQVQLFRKHRLLENSVLLMGVGLVIGMVLMTLFVSDVTLPDLAWAAVALVAAILFWYGLVQYSRVFHVPRRRIKPK
jgi:hypothetical protein